MKTKFLWLTSATLGVAVTVSPIVITTSCSNNKKIMIDEADQENGVSSATYDSMKSQLRVLYRNKLEREWTPKEKIEELMREMDKNISEFNELEHKMLTNSEENAFNYTDITSALSKWALDNYQIQLTRNSTKGWGDIIEDYNGLRDSCEFYMRNQHTFEEEDINNILARADNKANDLMIELQAKYPDDPLSAYIFSHDDLMACFEETCADIALMSAITRIKDFLDRYDFTFRELPNDEHNRYDKVLPKLTVNQPIKPEVMNDIFICFDKETGTEKPFDTYKSLPGYKIVPIFHKAIPNPINNVYQFEIDWTLVSMNFVETEQHHPLPYWTEQDVTAHLYKNNTNVQTGQDINKPLVEQKREGAFEVQYVDYSVLPSKAYEMKQLRSYYLDPTKRHINFKWLQTSERTEINKYEAFFEGVEPKASTGTLKFSSLGRSGLMICDSNTQQWEQVSDVIKRLDGDEREYTQISFVEQFVKYVNTTSKVTIDDPGEAHKVSHIFQYEYNDSVSKNHECIVAEQTLRRTDGFKISRHFFETANSAFNKAYKYFSIYFDNKYKEVYENARSLHLTFILNCASTAWQIAKCWLKMGSFIWECRYVEATKEALIMADIIANCVFIVLGETLWQKFLLEPIEKYVDNTEKFNKESSFIQLKNKFKEDLKYFVLADEDGNCDPDEMDAKYEDFAILDFQEEACPLFQFYTTINVQPVAVEFNQKVQQYGIAPEDFIAKFSSWMYWGTCKAIDWGYSATRATISLIIFWDWERYHWTLAMKALEFTIEFALEFLISSLIQNMIEAIIF